LTQSSPRAHGLDTLRALAIVSVIAYHVSGFHGDGTLPAFMVPIASMGWMGVDLFFVLSGYLIASQFLRSYRTGIRTDIRIGSRSGLWPFYRNRLFRILPAFGAVLALYLAVPIWRESASLPPLWQLLTFTQNLFVDRSRDRAFSHVWSLCVEEHFYLFFPLLVLAAMRKCSMRGTVAILAGLVLSGILIRSYFLFHLLQPLAASGDGFGSAFIERIYYPTYSHLDGLLAGVTLALVRTFRPVTWSALERRGHTLFAAGVCVIALAVYLTKDVWGSATGVSAIGDVIGFPVLSLGLGFLVASAVSSNGWLRFKLPGARLIATLAYSLYLTHKEMIHLVDRSFPSIAQGAMPAWLGAYVLFCLAAAALLYLCVERPFLLLRDRLWKPV
jgi:peptidoglycan/LPS O-acetylase OafA/YrhL